MTEEHPMTDTPNQHTVPTPVNQKLIVCPACGKDIVARVYFTFTASTDVDYHEKSFTTTAYLVGLSVSHDCSPKLSRSSGLT